MNKRTINSPPWLLVVCLALVAPTAVLAGVLSGAEPLVSPNVSSGARQTQSEIEELPGPVVDHINRADQLGRLKHYDEAVEEYKAAIKAAGRPVYTAYLNMGSLLFNKGDYAQAVEAYRQAVTIKPNSFVSHYNLAEALYSNQDYAGAEKEYRRVLELRPGRLAINARHFLGLAIYKQGRLDEAIAEYQAAIELAGGSHSEARYNLGIALLERGQPQAAEREFRLAIEQEKKSWPEAHYNLAQALEKQRRYSEAADEYDVYLKLAPAAANAQRMREYVDYLRRKK